MRIYVERSDVPFAKWAGDDTFQTMMNILNVHGVEIYSGQFDYVTGIVCSHVFSKSDDDGILNSLESAGVEIIFIDGIFNNCDSFERAVLLLEEDRE